MPKNSIKNLGHLLNNQLLLNIKHNDLKFNLKIMVMVINVNLIVWI